MPHILRKARTKPHLPQLLPIHHLQVSRSSAHIHTPLHWSLCSWKCLPSQSKRAFGNRPTFTSAAGEDLPNVDPIPQHRREGVGLKEGEKERGGEEEEEEAIPFLVTTEADFRSVTATNGAAKTQSRSEPLPHGSVSSQQRNC